MTVPDDPPSAGPERAFDPPPALAGRPCPAAVGDDVADEEEVAGGAGDVAAQPASPISAQLSAAAAIAPPLLFDSSRRTPGFALEAASAERVSREFVWLYFMMEVFCIWNLLRRYEPFQ